MDLEYYEFARNSVAEGSAGFSLENARGRTGFILKSPTVQQLRDLGKEFLGSVDLQGMKGQNYDQTSGELSGGIRRILPKRHPIYVDLYVGAINDVRGVGKYSSKTVPPDLYVKPIASRFPLYEQYDVQVEFTRPLYNIRPDSTIKTTASAYYNIHGVEVPFRYSNEWTRFLWHTPFPGTEFIQYKQNLAFFTTSDNLPPGAADYRQAAHFPGIMSQYLPDGVYKMWWTAVPLTYVTSPKSYLRNLPQGVINQLPFFDPAGDGQHMFQPGQLRWAGFSHTPYLPPSVPSNGQFFGLELGSSDLKLCNIELTFHYTNRDRFAERLPEPEQVGAFPVAQNGNRVIGGWNLQPNWTKPNSYFYVHSRDMLPNGDPTNIEKWYPSHPSFPFQLLFTNPDMPQEAYADMVEVAV